MENQIQVFQNSKFGEVHGYLDNDGTAYLNAEDVARGLGFVMVRKERVTTSGDNYTAVRWERVNSYLQEFGYSHKVGKGDFLPENMVYRLAMKANNETARDFQAWLADDVVPSIRRTGSYFLKPTSKKDIATYKKIAADPEFLIQIGLALKAEKEKVAILTKENEVLHQQIFDLTPKANYYDLILNCPQAISVTVIAKDYGLSAKKFNKLLNKLGVQFKVNGTWVLYSYYADRNWTVTKTHCFTHSDGTPDSRISTYWTQQGRKGLYELLKQNGYLPQIESNRCLLPPKLNIA